MLKHPIKMPNIFQANLWRSEKNLSTVEIGYFGGAARCYKNRSLSPVLLNISSI